MEVPTIRFYGRRNMACVESNFVTMLVKSLRGVSLKRVEDRVTTDYAVIDYLLYLIG